MESPGPVRVPRASVLLVCHARLARSGNVACRHKLRDLLEDVGRGTAPCFDVSEAQRASLRGAHKRSATLRGLVLERAAARNDAIELLLARCERVR
jgi:hypothetical protein